MAASNGTQPGSGFIPLIDFSPFLTSTSPAERSKTAAQVVSAFQTSGFIYLLNHGVPQPLLSRIYAHSAAFFARPQPEKDALAWTTPRANRGYTCLGREKVSQLADAAAVAEEREAAGEDLKESFEIGRPDDPGVKADANCVNRWPRDAEGREFEEEAMRFFALCKELHVQLMRALALGLGMEEEWFDRFTDGGDNTLRLLHYPPVRKGVFREREGQLRAGAHSDYGSLTLLFQDDRGGLQVQKPDGEFVDAVPIKDTCVVNAGDLLARWSNGLVKSTVHRVVEPPTDDDKNGTAKDEGVYPARYSIAYFCNPDFDEWIEAIPKTVKEGEKPKFAGVNSGDYLVQRLTATY